MSLEIEEMHTVTLFFPNPDCRPWNGNASTPVLPSQTLPLEWLRASFSPTLLGIHHVGSRLELRGQAG